MRTQRADKDIHREALRATAKIALGLVVAGCAGQVDVVETGAVRGAGGAPYAGPSGAGGSAPTPQNPANCDAPPPNEDVVQDRKTFACCVDYLGALPKPGGWHRADAELAACCHDVVAEVEMDPTLVQFAVPHGGSVENLLSKANNYWGIGCCDVLGNPCNSVCGCTVWGPPMPRVVALLRSLDELEQEAA